MGSLSNRKSSRRISPQSQQDWESIINNLTDMITVHDRDFNIIYANSAAEKILHLPLLHQNTKCFTVYHGTTRPPSGCPSCLCLETGEPSVSEFFEPNLDAYIEVRALPRFDEKDQLIGVVHIVRNITGQKQAALEIQQRMKLAELTADIGIALTKNIDQQNALQECARALIRHLDASLSRIWFYDSTEEVLRLQASAGMYEHTDGYHSQIPLGRHKIGLIAQSRRPHLTNRVIGDPQIHDQEWVKRNGIVAFAGHPLIVKDRLVGVMALFSCDPLKDVTLKALASVADMIALGIEGKQKEGELRQHRSHLMELVQDRTAELTASNELLRQEILDRRQAEQALRESEKKYRYLYDHAPDMYHSIDANKIIVECNETEAHMLGYDKSEIVGRPLSDFFTEESKKFLDRDFPRLRKYKVLKNLERTFVRKDGTTFPAILNVFGEFDGKGNLTRTRAIARDITDLKKAEEELRSLNRTLRVLSEFNYALLHVSEEGKLLREICRIIVEGGGYRIAWVGYIELGGGLKVHPVAYSGIDATDISQLQVSLTGSDRKADPVIRAIVTGKTARARNIMESRMYQSIQSDAVRLNYASSIAIPLTLKQKTKGILSIYAQEPFAFDQEEIDLLEKLVANLAYGIEVLRATKERKRAKAEALRAGHLASLGELAAGVAHEINNPINGIINYTQILANKSKEGSAEHDMALRIIRESDRIANIVRSLLSFARDSKEEKGAVNINVVLSDVMALTEAQLKKDGIKVILQVPEDIPPVLGHIQQIEQVFLNIISNARYALNQRYPGKHRDKKLEISGECINNQNNSPVRLIFLDSGTGIPSRILDRIFNPFFSTKPVNVGTGLGLSISHGIISDHGGRMSVESVEGSYTKVLIELLRKGTE